MMRSSETITVSVSEFKARCFELLNQVRDGKSVIGDIVRPIDEQWDVAGWFSELDRYADISFMEDGRLQPPMPPDRGADAL